MRGLLLALGYILGNKDARDKCVSMLKQASNIIDKEVRNTEIGKLIDEAWGNSGLTGNNKSDSKSEADKQRATVEESNRGQSPSGTRDID